MGPKRFLAAILTALTSALVSPAMAQQPQEQDVPGRVGRIAHMEGTVSVYQDAETGWEKGYINSPFTSENSVWTDVESRAELRVAGTAIRLDQTTQIDVVRLDDNEFESFIPRGTVSVRVRHFEKGDSFQFDTPYARFTLRANGRYRIDVDPDRQEARVTAFVGEAQVGSESGRVIAKAGDTVRVFGGDSPSYVVERAMSDPFDKWADSRDSAWQETKSVQYVSPQMTGYEDLDRNGSWSNEPDYGALWYPTAVATTWAPYRYGHWGYVRPWGWTWIDDSSWGYAPFHYGRWVNVRNRWAWSPGTRAPRPVWAPALVAWVGGAGFSVGVGGSPSVGWYPLSPWDRYQPWYRASNTYVNRVNVVVINNAPRGNQTQWRDYTRDHGATFVNRDVVVDRRPVQQAIVQVKPEVIRQAQVTTPAVALPPRQEVMERHAASVRLAAERPAPGTQRPVVPPPTPKPEFKPRPVVATQTPQPARVAPPPAVRVAPAPATPPTGRPATAPVARPATPPATREAPPPVARPAPPPATREAPPPAARPAPPPATRETPPPVARPATPPATREAPPPTARETPPPVARPAPPPATREAPPPVTREAPPPAARPAPPATPREAPPVPSRDAQQRAEEQRAAQAAQERARQQQQQQQQQQGRQPQAQPQPQPQARPPQPQPQPAEKPQPQARQPAPQPAEKPQPQARPPAPPPAEKPQPQARKEPAKDPAKEKKDKEEEEKRKQGGR
jgi:hypothetical protein